MDRCYNFTATARVRLKGCVFAENEDEAREVIEKTELDGEYNMYVLDVDIDELDLDDGDDGEGYERSLDDELPF